MVRLMVALFVVFLVAAFLVIDVILHLRQKPSIAEQLRDQADASAAEAGTRIAGFRVAPDAAYHPGHTWARHLGQGLARVGVDDFAAHLVGAPDRIDAPPVGAQVRAGRPLLTLVRKGRRIPVLAPVSGAVAAINKTVLSETGKVLADPYGAGWLLDIRSTDLAAEFRSLLSGEMARRLVDEAAGALHTYLSPMSVAAAADGGEPIGGIADMLDDPTWDRVRSRFLLTDTE